MERVFDIVLSGLALALLSPFLIPIGLVLLTTGEREIFFLQERVGKNGKCFNLYKFATMLKNSPNLGSGTITMKEDPRVLPVGKFLRKTKINELPQLLNIFFGDMSVVGPRPLTAQTFGAYAFNTQNIIKKVRPGLSGVGSIVFRAEEDIMQGAAASVDYYDSVIAPYKGALEEWFVSNRGLSVYFIVILATAWAVVFPKSDVAWRVFQELPEPPDDLKLALNYKA